MLFRVKKVKLVISAILINLGWHLNWCSLGKQITLHFLCRNYVSILCLVVPEQKARYSSLQLKIGLIWNIICRPG